MHPEIVYQIALSRVPQIGCIAAKQLALHFKSAKEVFTAKAGELARLEGIGSVRADNIKRFREFDECYKELEWMRKHDVQVLFITDTDYPKRLLNCSDSPTVLYKKGKCNLNADKVIAVVGTRNSSEYGKQCVAELLRSLQEYHPIVLSGMAYGIDTLAHREALTLELPTAAVLAHGLHTIYPAENRKLALEIIHHGGALISEFATGTKPDKHNFPSRNRIVAGMADVTIVIETDITGGSMITAELANSYNRDVAAFPGKANDTKSRGCNELIRLNKAALITNGTQLAELMGWQVADKPKQVQRQLFVELGDHEQVVYDLLSSQNILGVDEINLQSKLSTSSVAAALLSLELQGIVASLPGKLYKVV